MKLKGIIIFCSISLISFVMDIKANAQNSELDELNRLIERVSPLIAHHFSTEIIEDSAGFDVFELESINDKVVLRGNNGISLASAYNHYLSNN